MLHLAILVVGVFCLALGVIWSLIVVLGHGTYQFWIWDAPSWQAVGAGLTGLALTFVALMTWVVQRQQAAVLTGQSAIQYAPPLLFNTTEEVNTKEVSVHDRIPNLTFDLKLVNRAQVGITLTRIRTYLLNEGNGTFNEVVSRKYQMNPNISEGAGVLYSYTHVPPHQTLTMSVEVGLTDIQNICAIPVSDSELFKIKAELIYLSIGEDLRERKTGEDDNGNPLDMVISVSQPFNGSLLNSLLDFGTERNPQTEAQSAKSPLIT